MSTRPDRVERREWAGRAAFASIVAALYLLAMARAGLRGDLRAQLRFAEDFALVGDSGQPYPLFAQATIIVRTIVPWDLIGEAVPSLASRQATWAVSGLIVTFLAVAWTADLVRQRFLTWATSGSRSSALATWAAAGVLLLGPITALTWSDRRLLVGYVAPNAFDNATFLILRPFALLLFFLVADHLSGPVRRRTSWLVAAASIAVLLAKPTFTICFMPAVLALALLRTLRRRDTNWRFLLTAFVVPSTVVLLAQLVSSRGRGSIAVQPFGGIARLMDYLGQPTWWWLVLLVLSCATPLVVAAAFPRDVLAHVPLQLAWITMGIGTAYFVLLEIRGRPDYGEFLGAPQIALLILLVESTRLALSLDPLARLRARDPRMVLVVTAFALQVLFGAAFWVLEIKEPLTWH